MPSNATVPTRWTMTAPQPHTTVAQAIQIHKNICRTKRLNLRCCRHFRDAEEKPMIDLKTLENELQQARLAGSMRRPPARRSMN